MEGIPTVNFRSIAIPAKEENGEDGLDQKDAGQEVNEGLSESKRLDLWVHAGKVAKAEPKLLQWEVSHLLDGMLPRMSFFKFLDKIALGGGTTDSIHTGRRRISPPQDLFDLIQVSVMHVFQSRPLRISSVLAISMIELGHVAEGALMNLVEITQILTSLHIPA